MKEKVLITIIIILFAALFLNWQISSEVGRYQHGFVGSANTIFDTITGDYYIDDSGGESKIKIKITFNPSEYKSVSTGYSK